MTNIFKNTVKTLCLCLAMFLPLITHAQPFGEIIFQHGEEPFEIWIGNIRERRTSIRFSYSQAFSDSGRKQRMCYALALPIAEAAKIFTHPEAFSCLHLTSSVVALNTESTAPKSIGRLSTPKLVRFWVKTSPISRPNCHHIPSLTIP